MRLTAAQRRWVTGLDPERVTSADHARLTRLRARVTEVGDLAAIDAASVVADEVAARRTAERQAAQAARVAKWGRAQ